MFSAIDEVVQTVVTSVLGLEAVTIADRRPSDDVDRSNANRDSLLCRVEIAGSWDGAVLVWCPNGFASLAARIMFARETDGADDRDALGELTNMIAGCLKPLMPVPSQLALPAVECGQQFAAAMDRSYQVARAMFLVGGTHELVVSLVGHETGGAA